MIVLVMPGLPGGIPASQIQSAFVCDNHIVMNLLLKFISFIIILFFINQS